MAMRSLLPSIPKTPLTLSPFFFACFRFIATSPPSAIFQFLETECAFSSPQISKIMTAHKSLLRVRSTQTARQAVEFLRGRGFTESQLHTTILGYPTVLSMRVDSGLKPLFDFLTSIGFGNQDFTSLILRGLRLLGMSVEKNMKPRIPFLEKLFGSKASLIKGLKREPQLLIINFEKQLKPKVDILEKWGIEGELLSLLLSISVGSLSRIRMEELETRIEYVRNTLGVVEGSKTFVYAVHLLVAMGPQNLEKKVKHLENLGLLKEEVQQLLMKNPFLFCLSMDKMQRNMNFLTQTAGFQPNILLSNGWLLHFSVENRLKPRLAVFQALSAMQQPAPNLVRMLSSSEKIFLQKVVECSPHASILKEIYKSEANSSDVETT